MTSSRPAFDPVDTSFDPVANSRKDDVESPSLSSSNALARFEFEPGRSKDGTKVLMVEWEDDDTTRNITYDWEISWDGKKTVLPAKDQPKPANGETPVNRLYFMLGPGVRVPTSVKLRKGATVEWRTNPLPAIFSADLGATAREEGRKGVLHTIWAKKRLQVLQKEIDAEAKENGEGVGLEMAVAEKAWIEQNFGVVAKPTNLNIPTGQSAMISVPGHLNSPTSPRSPGGGRLMDKLKGLKIGTSSDELAGASNAPGGDAHNPLSPETSDMALGSVSSFAALRGPSATIPSASQQKMTAVRPPERVVAEQQQQGGGRMASLNAFASTNTGFAAPAAAASADGDDNNDDLFALPISPRSPDMAKSPFSFAAQDTRKYVKG